MKKHIKTVKDINLFMKHKKKIIAVVLVGLVILIAVISVIVASLSSQRDYGYATSESYYEEVEYGAGNFALDTFTLSSAQKISNDSISFPPIAPQPSEAPYQEDAERKLIKNGSLSLVVNDIASAREGIENTAEMLGGFVSNAWFNERDSYDYANTRNSRSDSVVRSGSLTIRIPAAEFDRALVAFKGYALKVQNENISSNDVTEQYADLETQIENKLSEESQYRAILEQATEIEDVLKVTQYLNQTRSQIEQMQGRLNRLSNQVTLSTITVSLTSEEDLEFFGVVWSPWDEIKSAFQSMLNGLVGFLNTVIGLLFVLPVVAVYVGLYGLLAVIILVLIYKTGRFFWNKRPRK